MCWSRCRCLQRTEVHMVPKEPVPARIMIVDDHALAREGLRAILAHQQDLAVVAEAEDAGEARALCRRVCPDLILMDVRMPGVDGLAATATIKQEFPAIIVIIITMYENPDYLLQAIRAGAAGYLLKDATAREVLTAVRQVLHGEFPLRPGVAARLLQSLTRERERPVTLPEGQLTPREQAVLRLVAQGQTNRELPARSTSAWVRSSSTSATLSPNLASPIAPRRRCARSNSGSLPHHPSSSPSATPHRRQRASGPFLARWPMRAAARRARLEAADGPYRFGPAWAPYGGCCSERGGKGPVSCCLYDSSGEGCWLAQLAAF